MRTIGRRMGTPARLQKARSYHKARMHPIFEMDVNIGF